MPHQLNSLSVNYLITTIGINCELSMNNLGLYSLDKSELLNCDPTPSVVYLFIFSLAFKLQIIGVKSSQREQKLLTISGDFELSEFELSKVK